MKIFLKKNKQNETEGSKSESVKCKSKKSLLLTNNNRIQR